MKKQFYIVVTLISLALFCTGCNNTAKVTSTVATEKSATVSGDLNQQLKDNASDYIVAQNDFYALSINGKTAAATITDKTTGYQWKSNPDTTGNLTEDQKDFATCQFQLETYDSTDKQLLYNSSRDSAALSQVSYSSVKNGIKITYVVGKENKVYLVPKIIEKQRFETFLKKMSSAIQEDLLFKYQLISLKNLSDSEKKSTLSLYPEAKDKDIYVLSSDFPDYILEEMDKEFGNAGYTLDDLTKDNLSNNVAAPEQPINFTVSLVYELTDKGFSVTVPYQEIKASNKSTILTKINLLPNFGAGSLQDNGYLFVPDGSGAIIHLNNHKEDFSSYSLDVYGKDNAIMWKKKPESEKQCLLPVYGMVKDSHGFAAIIESADCFATINANTANQLVPYNIVNTSFQIRSFDQVNVSLTTAEKINKYSSKQINEDIKVNYTFLNNEDASYSGMATVYRNYLIQKGDLKQAAPASDLSFNAELIGSIDYKKSIFGIPVTVQKPITTYTQALNIAKELNQAGINNINLNYTAWQNGGASYSKSSGIKLLSALGGKKEFKKLLGTAGKYHAYIYPDADMLYTFNTSLFRGYNAYTSSAKFLSNDFAKKYYYNLSTNRQDYSIEIISPKKFESYSSSYIKDMQKFDMKYLSVDTLGTDLNSDFNQSKTFTRKDTKDSILNMLQKLTDNRINLTTAAGNSYVYKYVNSLTDVPMSSSNHYLIDQSVPFLQMVLHGYINMFSQPLNLSDNIEEDTLRLIEYGISPEFLWSYASNDAFKNTDYDYYSTYYKSWLEKAVQIYKKTNGVLGSLSNVSIKNHYEIQKNVYATEYENGTVIYVNYTNQSQTVLGNEISAKSFFVGKKVE